MSGRGKGGKVRSKPVSRSKRAGLQFPVGRIHRLLRTRRYSTPVAAGAAVNGTDEEGCTALMLGAQGGHVAAMEALVQGGAEEREELVGEPEQREGRACRGARGGCTF